VTSAEILRGNVLILIFDFCCISRCSGENSPAEASPCNFYSLVHVISSWSTTFSVGECVEIKPYQKRLLFELIEKPYECCDIIALPINITFILGGIP